MRGLFKPKPRKPVELVRRAHDLLVFVERNTEAPQHRREEKISELSKAICEMRTILYGNGETEPNPDACAQLTQEFFMDDTFCLLITCLPRLNSGARQYAVHVIANLQRQWVKSQLIASEHLKNNMDLLDILIPVYEESDIALVYGAIARECICHQVVARYVLESEHMRKFFYYIQNPLFYIATDAAATFRVKHKSTVVGFLSANYDWFFKEYNTQLLESSSYIIKRQAVKLLGDLLLDSANAAVMVRYVSSLDNLRILMNLLREPNKRIQIDAFDVFKLFVANRNKPPEIIGVLVANRNKLLRFLADFNLNKENERFEADRTRVMREISILRNGEQ